MKKKHVCPKSLPKWMATFSDMVTLLLTFFVLLLSMANFDKVKIYQFLGILSGGAGVLSFNSEFSFAEQNIVARTAIKDAIESSKDQVEESLKELVQAQNLDKLVSIVKTDKGISVRIMDSVFFTTGSATLLTSALPILDRIIIIAEETPYNVNVEGHTDDTIVNAGSFFNWELSTDRAVSVVKYFVDNGFDPSRLSASGFGEYHPLLPNITAENRAKNRRVEINLTSPEFAETGDNIF